ncbi:MAG: hypothetical protein B7Z08_09935 [Sphingomonadales bacterium 32-68-7]|nr:MAG: hypothetical protein B7Z33_00315 [Sphingomonadales bacterium 12-68-11]OYX08374.1 MAG: hypothetical protein B7Z08_09935 [Sphingomonadales bacterium 32-68-7]
MSEIADALGSAAEGSLLGRAVEPGTSTGRDPVPGADGHTHESACLNCGTELIGPHCHACGQRGHMHRTIGAFFHDLLHGVLHFEGKTWNTLPMLAWRPGALTRRYIAGERAKFVSPMALFLFSVFLMFAVFQIVGIGPPSDFTALEDAATVTPEQQLAGLREARGSMRTDDPAAGTLDRQIARLEREIDETPAAPPAPAPSGRTGAPELLAQSADGSFRLNTVRSGWPALDNGIKKWRENPSLMAYKLQSNGYKYSWLLIPLSIPFVGLLFAWRRKFGAYDHAVFVTYSLAFMTLLFVAIALLGQIPGIGTPLFFATVLIPPLHIYKQLKGAYGLTRFSALWRTFVLMTFIGVILTLFLSMALLLGVIG